LRSAELDRGLVNGLQGHLAATINDMIEEFHAMLAFFLGLYAHPTGKAQQVGSFEVGGHGQVQIGRVQLFPNLYVHFV
jgi:hypothetical protein